MNINCIVDVASREVSFQDTYRIASYDHNVDVIHFSVEPIEDFSLNTSSIKIAAQGPNKSRHDYAVDPSTVAIEEETGYITFDWPIPAGVTEMPIGTFKYGDKGQLIFAVCAEIIDGSTVSKAWHSDDGIITVVAHLEPEAGGGEEPEEEATNRQMIGQLQTATAILQREIGGIASGTPPTADSTSEMDPDESTVYINTTDEKWYYWDGTAFQPGGTYGGVATDTTLSIAGVPADSKGVGDALTAFEADVDDKLSDVDFVFSTDALDTPTTADLVQGGFNSSTGANYNSTKRVRSNSFYKCTEGLPIEVETDEGKLWVFVWYTTNAVSGYISLTDLSAGAVTPPEGANYYRFGLANQGETVIAPADVTTLNVHPLSIAETVNDLSKNVESKTTLLDFVDNDGDIYTGITALVQGSYNASGKYYNATNRVRNNTYFPVMKYRGITINANGNTGYKYCVYFYNTNENNPTAVGKSGFVSCGTFTYAPATAKYFRFLVARTDDATLAPEDVTSISCDVYTINKCVYDLNNAVGIGNDYSVDCRLKKSSLVLSQLGQLTYLQSFCRYNGKFYSTDGNNIGVQDGDLTAETSISISVGHGNAFHTGILHPNYGYISGWNDQKVYVVDLDNLTLVDTITLPTTGYTTCAIDDLNQIAYILQRDTPTHTEEHYNFIAYDYANEQELYRRKTYKPFGALQDMDFVNGLIYVNSGGGTNALPNYHLVYDTQGTIVAEYIFNTLANVEPEGICVDGEKMYISTAGKYLYEVTT